MHIAFLCDETTKYSDANLEICTRLAREFQSRGCRVSILGNCENADAPLRETRDGIDFYRFYYPINRITHQILNEYNRDHSLGHLALSLLRHPVTACVDVIRAATGYNPIDGKYVALLNRVHRERKVDMVIGCGGSFYPIHALAKSKIKCLRVGYMLDPYWKNHAVGGARAKKEELFAWNALDHMVIPTLLAADYEDPAFDTCRHKAVAAEFPGIQQDMQEGTASFQEGKINLLFAGNFYEQIRSPQYLLDLMDNLPEGVCLNVMGGIYGSFGAEITDHMQRLSERGKLRLHGTVSAAQARAAMNQADVLINIGNKVDNQLPSKIFEYFSTGKPVIHIQKIPDCPCIPYMERYGNALILPETEPAEDCAKKAAAFLAAGRAALPFGQVKSRFEDCTIAHVADLFFDFLGEDEQ